MDVDRGSHFCSLIGKCLVIARADQLLGLIRIEIACVSPAVAATADIFRINERYSSYQDLTIQASFFFFFVNMSEPMSNRIQLGIHLWAV